MPGSLPDSPPDTEQPFPDKRYHFISGLPRSGSTLISAILRQNPRFHVDMSSPVGELFNTLLTEMSARNEGAVSIDNAQHRRILRGLFDNYCADHGEEVIFDTNRLWSSKLSALSNLFPKARVIACVRSMSWIIDSIERLIQKNALEPSSIFNYQSGGTVYTRANGVAGSAGLGGFAYDALKPAVYGGEAQDRLLLLVRYESLTQDPRATLNAIYAFLGEPAYAHDFEQIAYDDRGFDAKPGTSGLHTVRQKVESNTRKTLLPPDLFKRFENDAFWLDARNLPQDVKPI